MVPGSANRKGEQVKLMFFVSMNEGDTIFLGHHFRNFSLEAQRNRVAGFGVDGLGETRKLQLETSWRFQGFGYPA